MKLYLRLIKYIGPYKVRLLLAGLCTLVAAGGTIYLPWIIKDVVDQILAEKDLVKNTVPYLTNVINTTLYSSYH